MLIVQTKQDVDHLTLIIALTPEDKNIRFRKCAPVLEMHSRKFKGKCAQLMQLFRHRHVWKTPRKPYSAHAFRSCDSTYAFFSKGKAQTINKLKNKETSKDVVLIFNNVSTRKLQVPESALELYKSLRAEMSPNPLPRTRILKFRRA